MAADVHNPTMVMGDFNARPNSLGPVADWIRDEQWTDLGQRANWWGGVPDRWTCHSKADAKPSRIDGVVVDAETLCSVRSFEVEKRTHIPTHCVLKVAFTRNPFKEKRTFLQKLGSLKNVLEEKWKAAFKEMPPKEAVAARLDEVKKLKDIMDELFRHAAESLDEACQQMDTDGFWRIWSETTEKAYHRVAELSEKDAKKNSGRGTVKLIQRVPENRAKEDDRIRNKWSYAARRCIRQARRCEQIVFRIQAKQKKAPSHIASTGPQSRVVGGKLVEPLPPEPATSGAPALMSKGEAANDETDAQHQALNTRATQLLVKNTSEEHGWEREERNRLIDLHKRSDYTISDVPALKRIAGKYHTEYATNRRKSVEEYRKAQYEAYQTKGKGICDLHRPLRKDPATPLVAVRRKQKGGLNQKAGTIATSPKEVDAIIRGEYGRIYEGHHPTRDNPQDFAAAYMKKYKDFIHKQPELTIELSLSKVKMWSQRCVV